MMEKQLKIAVVTSEDGKQPSASGTYSYALLKNGIEGFGDLVTGNTAGELSQADGLICIITDNAYEEVRKTLTYALDKEKPVAYTLEEDVLLDEGMRLQLGLAWNLGKASEDAGRLREWLDALRSRKTKEHKKRMAKTLLLLLAVLAVVLVIVIVKPGRQSAGAETNAAEALPENDGPGELKAVAAEDPECLTSLDLSGTDLTDITFLQHCVNLEELDLSDNRISDISVLSKLKKLKKLDISNNEITDINILLVLPELKEVDISKNPVADDTVLDYLKGVEVVQTDEN